MRRALTPEPPGSDTLQKHYETKPKVFIDDEQEVPEVSRTICGPNKRRITGGWMHAWSNNPFPAAGVDDVQRLFSLGPPSLLLAEEAP